MGSCGNGEVSMGRIITLGIIALALAGLGAVAALQTSTSDAGAQPAPYPMSALCRDYYTGLYKGAFSASCPPGHQLLPLPDSYPLSLCASAYDGFLRAPNYAGDCPPGTAIRIELPSETPFTFCYAYATGRLRMSTANSTGSCGPGTFAVALPFETGADDYRALGNMDIDVPAGNGLLANDTGAGLTVVAFDAMSANGGEVDVSADGAFTYITPPPTPGAFAGTDTFEYTIEDSNGVTEVATAMIEVITPAVWFVDADATDPGDGRRQTPLNDIQVLNDDGNDPDVEGDFIFLYEAAADYSGGLELEIDQTLVGQNVSLEAFLGTELGVTSSLQGLLASLPEFLVYPETDPTPGNSMLTGTTSTLVMADDTTAAGLVISSTLGRGVSASDAGNLLLESVDVTGGNEGIGLPGVALTNSEMHIVDSLIAGGTGAEAEDFSAGSSLQGLPTFAGDGGHGVLALDSALLVEASQVTGGVGGDGVELGGDGGAGIAGEYGTVNGATSTSSLQGQSDETMMIAVIDSTIAGGPGGVGTGAGEGFSGSSILLGDDPPVVTAVGGAGGGGVIAFDASGSTLQGPGAGLPVVITVSNSTVLGAPGGDASDIGGPGGPGISGFMVSVIVENGAAVIGGPGGDALIQDSGDGGTGIALEGSSSESLDVTDSTVTGGPAGNSPGSIGPGGDGVAVAGQSAIGIGSGSSLAGAAIDYLPVSLVNTTVTGANGVDAANGAGGEAGSGVVADTADITVESGSTISAGAAGDGDTGAPGADGINASFSPTTVTGSTISGGAAGMSNNDVGLAGGAGIVFDGCAACDPLAVSGSTINGGTGGAALTMGAGRGGPGILGGNNSIDVDTSLVTGGAPGADGSGRGGPAGTAAVSMSYEEPASFSIALSSNTLEGSAGDPGQAPSVDVSVSTGDVCFDATGNTPTGAFDLTNGDGLAISQADVAALMAANNGVAVNVTGSLGFSCAIL